MIRLLLKVFSANVVVVGTTAIGQLLLAKVLGAEQFGKFAVLLTLSLAMLMLLCTAPSVVLLRDVPLLVEQGDQKRISEVVFATSAAFLVGLILVYVCTSVAVYAMDLVSLSELQACALFVLVHGINRIVATLIRIYGSTSRSALADSLPRELAFILVAAGAFALGLAPSVSTLLYAASLGLLISIVAGVLSIRRSRFAPGLAVPRFETLRTDLWSWASLGYASIVVNLTQYLMRRIDTVAVSVACGYTVAGVYAFFARLFDAASLIVTSVNLIVAPKISKLVRSGDTAGLWAIERAYSRASLLMTSAFCVVILLLCRPLGTTFVGDAASLLPWSAVAAMALANIINASYPAANSILMYSGHESVPRRNVIRSGLILLLAIVPLAWLAGASGAALATVLAIAYWKISLARAAKRLLPIPQGAATRQGER